MHDYEHSGVIFTWQHFMNHYSDATCTLQLAGAESETKGQFRS